MFNLKLNSDCFWFLGHFSEIGGDFMGKRIPIKSDESPVSSVEQKLARSLHMYISTSGQPDYDRGVESSDCSLTS